MKELDNGIPRLFLPSAKPHGQQVAFRTREEEGGGGGIFKKPVSPNTPDISPGL